MLLAGACGLSLERANALVRVPEGRVLQQSGLDQRIKCIGRLAQPLPDETFGIRVARGILNCCQTSEQITDEVAFFRGHRIISWSLHRPAPCRARRRQGNGRTGKYFLVGESLLIAPPPAYGAESVADLRILRCDLAWENFLFSAFQVSGVPSRILKLTPAQARAVRAARETHHLQRKRIHARARS